MTDAGGLAAIDPAAMLAGDAERVDHPLLLVCVHGRRDRCCARYGAAVFTRACERAGTEAVWQCTHVGGDRFAGNLVCLPEGLYFGHLDPDAAGPGARGVRRRPDRPRPLPRPVVPLVPAAGGRARRARGDRDLGGRRRPFRRGSASAAREWLVRFAAGGGDYDVRVSRADGEPMLLTCDATVPHRAAPLRGRGGL